ncbi:hypothetical protein [Thalassomonas sp. RHCl1]|uniref:hypothetical protein n=1 Tax=Thalassomonas sp. RHCl1 TaxID=2995320 RepID=UPI00248C976F|nr:hypothetical protein [Thalassomonas sp. RHCl1]
MSEAALEEKVERLEKRVEELESLLTQTVEDLAANNDHTNKLAEILIEFAEKYFEHETEGLADEQTPSDGN